MYAGDPVLIVLALMFASLLVPLLLGVQPTPVKIALRVAMVVNLIAFSAHIARRGNPRS
jgi:hypothetical protein